MSLLLRIVGYVWAAFGVLAAVRAPWLIRDQDEITWIIILSFLVFIFPGLFFAYLGISLKLKEAVRGSSGETGVG